MLRARAGLYACVILISSFLLFQVQPIIAKLILPWFGGSAGVWTVCMLFFQTVLVAGYLYAHWSIRRLSRRANAAVHAALLLASIAVLPIAPGAGWKPDPGADPALRILLLLTVCVGLPYFLLSSTSPLLQAWYTRTHQKAAPYRLFAVSNFGSFLGLLSYPVLVEPWLSARWQSATWSGGYIAFAVLCAATGLAAARAPDGDPVAETDSAPRKRPGWPLWLLWTALPAIASVLLLAVTNHLTQNVAPVPFLWVLPLALYLLSFVLCFGHRVWYNPQSFTSVVVVALFMMALLAQWPNLIPRLGVQIFVLCASLFIVCVFCHGELARHKPEPAFLTGFYLMVSVGGALGGAFVGLAAPHLFSGYLEFPIGLALCAFAGLILAYRQSAAQAALWAVVTAVMLFAVAITIGLGAAGSIAHFRNFYGPVRVVEETGVGGRARLLYHGTIIHGAEMLGASIPPQPTTYYGPRSGAGIVLNQRAKSPLRVGVIGLGAGTLAAYGRPGDYFRFYEINPGIIAVARANFDFLRLCPARLDVVLGDARLSMEREPPQGFDVLVVDAFSGDSIPVHLLDKEAFALYLRHLNRDGILAIHLSNQFLDLGPVVAGLARAHGLSAVGVAGKAEPAQRIGASNWALVSRDAAQLATPALKASAEPLPFKPGLRLWTDDYSNLLSVLR